MTNQQMQEWKEASIKQAEDDLYGELLASYSEAPFINDEFYVNFGEGWRKI